MEPELIVVGGRVLIEPLGDTDKTDSGLYLPHSAILLLFRDGMESPNTF